ILKKHKVPVIAITRFAESDLSVMADYKLWVASSEYLVRSAAMTSRLAQLHVIDILYSAYIKLDYENNIERIEKTQMKKVRS
ncbi:MurR/RpiR family transcriptional regulator, partial [Hungatella effluvii]